MVAPRRRARRPPRLIPAACNGKILGVFYLPGPGAFASSKIDVKHDHLRQLHLAALKSLRRAEAEEEST